MDAETRHKMIEALAYEIYVREGRPIGRAVRHWLAAEKELHERRVREHELKLQKEAPASKS